MRGSEAKWVASTTDEAVQAQVGAKATVKQQGEREGEQSVAFGQVGIVVKDPNGNSTVIVASTKDMTMEGATKALNYITADEPQPELYSEIVGVNKFPAVIESEEDTIEVDTQDAGDTNSEKFIATNKLTDGTEVFTFYSKSANSLVRLNAEELKKALLGQKFKFSFTGVQPNERGWLDFVTVKKEQGAYAAVADNLGQEFKDITMQKKFQVALGSMMNNAAYVSPLTGTQYNSYFEYLTSTTEFSDPRTDGLGANAILTTDKYAHGPSSPFYDVGVSLSQLTTLEGDVKTEEEMELKQVVETSKPAPAPQPTVPASTDVDAEKRRAEDLNKIFKKFPKLSEIFDNDIVKLDNYLKNIFPNASDEFKGSLFFHGAKNPIEGNRFKISEKSLANGLWFTKQLGYAKRIESYKDQNDTPITYGVVLNIKSPKHFYNSSGALLVQRPLDFEKEYDKDVNDAAIFHHPESSDGKFTNEGGYNQVVVFDENQVHIIGDENDLKLAKEFNAKYDAELASPKIQPTTTPAVVQAPAAPKVTSSSQVIEDDLSLLMNPSKPIEEKPVSSDIIILPFDPNAAAVSASEKASVNQAQTEELSKALREPMSDFGDLISAAKTQGGQTKNDC